MIQIVKNRIILKIRFCSVNNIKKLPGFNPLDTCNPDIFFKNCFISWRWGRLEVLSALNDWSKCWLSCWRSSCLDLYIESRYCILTCSSAIRWTSASSEDISVTKKFNCKQTSFLLDNVRNRKVYDKIGEFFLKQCMMIKKYVSEDGLSFMLLKNINLRRGLY